MCRSASMIVGRNRVWWSPDNDSHEGLIHEAGLTDDLRGLDAVRVEIIPPSGDYSLPLAEWEYHVDQDQLPDWYAAAEGEAAARAELLAWAAHHIIREGKIEVREGQTRILLDEAHAEVHGGEVTCYGSSRAVVHGCELIIGYDSSRITVHRGKAWCHDSSRVTVYGGEVTCYGSSRVTVYGGEVICHDSAHVRVHGGEVTCYGSSRVTVHGGEVWCYGSSRAVVHGGDVRCCGSATIDDRRSAADG